MLNDETEKPTTNQKSSLGDLDDRSNNIPEENIEINPQQSIPQLQTRLPQNLSYSHNKIVPHLQESAISKEPLRQVITEDISEDRSFHTAQSFQKQDDTASEVCRLQRNTDNQPNAQDSCPKDTQHLQKEMSNLPAAELSQRHDLDLSKKLNQSFSRRLNQRGFNNPSANYCFAHALLQILYGLPEFRERTRRLAGQKKSNEILNKLCELFENIEDEMKAQSEIERTKEELLERIKQKNQGVKKLSFSSNYVRSKFFIQMEEIVESYSKSWLTIFAKANPLNKTPSSVCFQRETLTNRSLARIAKEDQRDLSRTLS